METVLDATYAALSAKPLAVPVALKAQTLDAGIASEERDAGIVKLLGRCSVEFDDKAHDEEWRNQVARDLNRILAALWRLDIFDCDERDIAFAEAALRIVERVAEFEQITEVDDKADAQEKAFYAQCEPHHAGEDENLT